MNFDKESKSFFFFGAGGGGGGGEMDANLTGLFLFNFESTSFKNHSDTNLVKIHYAVIEILSFSCSALFLVTAATLESQTAKKYNGFIQETFWHKDGSISTDGS